MAIRDRTELSRFFAPLAPGIALAVLVAAAAAVLVPVVGFATGGRFTLPAIVIALFIGVALHPWVAGSAANEGLTWCVKSLLRYAVALLGFRIALGDITSLGLGVAVLVVLTMVLTLASGLLLARWLEMPAGYGALAGAANAICGASATLAAATVVPNYPQKAVDIAFTVVAANAVSTLVMIAYPIIAVSLGYGPTKTGILLGGTIHDMAQVVGAGYAVSEPVGNTAVIVKLFRVFLLLPMVLAILWWFKQSGAEAGPANVPMPTFAFAFIAFSVLNSILPAIPGIATIYAALKPLLIHASTIGMLLAIAALGLQTSLTSLLTIGWRHLFVFFALTAVTLSLMILGLSLMA
jgi:uncharacterized integral membrane protein (TIGR00698 family)